jgi:flagellar basal-body rod protein FlgC
MGVSAIDISASGMRAQRLRMETIANNLANVDTTDAGRQVEVGPNGERFIRFLPYRRKEVVFQAGKSPGVSTPMVLEDTGDFRIEFDPSHPHSVKTPGAADWGKVYKPNVNPISEMVDMIAASRAYEANITAVETFKSMSAQTLRILA